MCAWAVSGLLQISLFGFKLSPARIFSEFHLSQWRGDEAGRQIKAILALICQAATLYVFQ